MRWYWTPVAAAVLASLPTGGLAQGSIVIWQEDDYWLQQKAEELRLWVQQWSEPVKERRRLRKVIEEQRKELTVRLAERRWMEERMEEQRKELLWRQEQQRLLRIRVEDLQGQLQAARRKALVTETVLLTLLLRELAVIARRSTQLKNLIATFEAAYKSEREALAGARAKGFYVSLPVSELGTRVAAYQQGLPPLLRHSKAAENEDRHAPSSSIWEVTGSLAAVLGLAALYYGSRRYCQHRRLRQQLTSFRQDQGQAKLSVLDLSSDDELDFLEVVN